MAVKKGPVLSSNVNKIEPDVSSELALLDVNRYPLYAILTNAGKDPMTKKGKPLKKESCSNHEFKWYENSYAETSDKINNVGGYAASDTDLVVDNGSYFNVNDVILFPSTSERAVVKSISSNTLTVERGVGDTSASSLSDDAEIFRIGSAYGEGTTSEDAAYKQSTLKSNYTQIFKTPFEVTGTHEAEETYTGKTMNEQREIKGVEHAIDIERAFLFGEKGTYTDSNGKPHRLTRGTISTISSNVKDESSSSLTETEFEAFLANKAFANGSHTKWFFASPRIISDINSFARDSIRIAPGDQSPWGLVVREYLSPHGRLMIVKEPLFEGSTYAGYGMVLDMEAIKYKYLKGRDTKLQVGIQAPDEDTQKDQYLTECGLEMKNEERHALIKGVSA